MRRAARVLALVLLAAWSPAAAAERVVLKPGAAAPAEALSVQVSCTDGSKATIASASGKKGTLILFTCNHCPFVKAWQERMVAVAHRAQSKGIGVIALNANDVKRVPGDAMKPMKDVAAAKGYRFPYGCDEGARIARAFGATRTPEAFLLDASGRVVYHGAIDDNAAGAAGVKERWLSDAVDALAEGREIAVKETKAIGCAIKFPAVAGAP